MGRGTAMPSQLNVKRAVRNRVYTDKTHLRGLRIFDFVLVHEGGLCLCSREFHSPRLKLTPMGNAVPLQWSVLIISTI